MRTDPALGAGGPALFRLVRYWSRRWAPAPVPLLEAIDAARVDGAAAITDVADEQPAATVPLERAHWARLMREVLAELPTPRDRELIVAFYLEEQDKDAICTRLGLTGEHFNRVVHRARERFRELLERRGFRRGDFLSLLVAVVG